MGQARPISEHMQHALCLYRAKGFRKGRIQCVCVCVCGVSVCGGTGNDREGGRREGEVDPC